MSKIIIRKIDEVKMRVFCESATLRHDIKEAFSFFVPGYRHMPKFKWGFWDGRISLYEARTQTMYLGLLSKVLEFAKTREVEVEYLPEEFLPASFELENFLKDFKSDYELRDYQLDVLKIAAVKKKALFLSATGSGKSFIIYSLIRMIEQPTLLIVPSLQLVGQMYEDFKEYATRDSEFDVQKYVQQIHGGESKEVIKPIVISTWQSIYKLPEEYFSAFKLVIADECHEDKAAKLRQLLEKCTESEYRYGFTGTLDGHRTNEMILNGLFGDIHQVSRTSELIEKGYLAKLSIKQIVLQYPDEIRKDRARKVNKIYDAESDFLLNHQGRAEFITKLALRCPGNTLILFQKVEEHGKKIYEHLIQQNEQRGLGRQIFFIHGKIPKDERMRIVNVAEKSDGVIIVASLGTFSRGINVRNLENLIFAFGLKAKITTLQGIGRGLRVGRSDKALVFDICDDLSWKRWTNYSLRHAAERLSYYQQERFDYSIVKVKL